MRRREFLALAGGTVAGTAFPPVGFAQQPAKMARILLLAVILPPETAAAFRAGLGDYGWVDGKNVSVQLVTAPTYSDLALLVPAAVASNPDLILAWGIAAAGYARQYTTSIPIVLGGSAGDPLDSGLIASWARPGNNITGTTLVAPDLLSKQMNLLKEMMPAAKRVALLSVSDIAVTKANITQAEPIAQSLGLGTTIVNFAEGKDLASQFPLVVAAAADEVYVPASPYFALYRDTLYDLLLKNKLPALASGSEAGLATPFAGVVSCGPNADVVVRKSGYYVDAILKGARPSDLPIEFVQPTVFDFAVNTWMATAIGFTIPPHILAQASLVIDYDIRAPKATAR